MRENCRLLALPLSDLRNLERMEKSQIELLEKRIEESQEEQEKNYLYPKTKSCAYDEPTIFTLRENGNIEENIISEKDRETDNTSRKETICIKRKNIVIDGLDPYFVEAGMFVIDKDKASIGIIQRVFKIGFNRAARIMDQLAQAGFVGEEEGTKPRKILMSMDMFTQYIEEYEEWLLFTANRSQISIKNIFPLYVFYNVRHEKPTVLYIFCRKRKFCLAYILTKIIEDIPPWAILRP